MKDDTGGSELTPAILLQAYRLGIFPMAEHRHDPEVFWVDPKRRGVLPLAGFHISRSLRRRMRDPAYRVTLNHAFAEVVECCADRSETWINEEIQSLYNDLHGISHAHSLEVWHDNRLIGGVYGVSLGAAFFGESMFSHARDGSKIALACLSAHLRACGFTLFDTQFVTPHLQSLGAIEVPRAQYHEMLGYALTRQARVTSHPLRQPHEVVQRSTQTS